MVKHIDHSEIEHWREVTHEYLELRIGTPMGQQLLVVRVAAQRRGAGREAFNRETHPGRRPPETRPRDRDHGFPVRGTGTHAEWDWDRLALLFRAVSRSEDSHVGKAWCSKS